MHSAEYPDKLATAPASQSRSWRCRACGQERDHRSAFDKPCPGERPPLSTMTGGYSIDDDCSRRALSEQLTVRFVTFGSGYAVDTEGGERYIVDVEALACSCQADGVRGVYCEHLRRVDLAIRMGELPGPDGRYVR